MLVPQAKFGDFHVSQHATYGMSAQDSSGWLASISGIDYMEIAPPKLKQIYRVTTPIDVDRHTGVTSPDGVVGVLGKGSLLIVVGVLRNSVQFRIIEEKPPAKTGASKAGLRIEIKSTFLATLLEPKKKPPPPKLAKAKSKLSLKGNAAVKITNDKQYAAFNGGMPSEIPSGTVLVFGLMAKDKKTILLIWRKKGKDKNGKEAEYFLSVRVATKVMNRLLAFKF